jgi:hypothetical protein
VKWSQTSEAEKPASKTRVKWVSENNSAGGLLREPEGKQERCDEARRVLPLVGMGDADALALLEVVDCTY